MTPTRSSRRYQYLKGTAFQSGRYDKPAIPMVPEANAAVISYPFSTLGLPAVYDVVQRLAANPDQGSAAPP